MVFCGLTNGICGRTNGICGRTDLMILGLVGGSLGPTNSICGPTYLEGRDVGLLQDGLDLPQAALAVPRLLSEVVHLGGGGGGGGR